MIEASLNKWRFWVDRGGTFTDIVAIDPQGQSHSYKLLSEAPHLYKDAVIHGIRQLLQIDAHQPLPDDLIHDIRMGTTVATNALLEHQGEPTLLITTKGFADLLKIGYQNRPDLFALDIQLPQQLYTQVLEVDQRITADGTVIQPLDLQQIKVDLTASYNQGISSVAIVLMHSYRFPQHEQQIAALAREIGFEQVSISSDVSPLIKIVSRGDTTVVDAYLSPILRRYVNQVRSQTGTTPLYFMQSNGGLTKAEYFFGRNSILSGPAGGIVGAAVTSEKEGYSHIIGFDMGGTSTDVSHYAGQYERSFDSKIAGVRIRTPMMNISTIAAGGGSVLTFADQRFQVGPSSAGAFPGPAAYGHQGPLTLTDANVILGKIHPDYFPKVFGPQGNQPLNYQATKNGFETLAQQINGTDSRQLSLEEIAQGYIQIAVEHMARAIKQISVQQGHDIREYALCSFGGAGAQHACLVAEALGMKRVLLHQFAGVLSAYGMGCADVRILKEVTTDIELQTPTSLKQLEQAFLDLYQSAQLDLEQQSVNYEELQEVKRVFIRYQGTDQTLEIQYFQQDETLRALFEEAHLKRYGFIYPDRHIIAAMVSFELVAVSHKSVSMVQNLPSNAESHQTQMAPLNVMTTPIFTKDQWHEVPVFHRHLLKTGERLQGPALIIEDTSTIVVEPDWNIWVKSAEMLVLEFTEVTAKSLNQSQDCDPIRLELYNNIFMSIAEQMGQVLRNTCMSVNIKERLDFSCALFDQQGLLVANAPHVPVHLGSISESVKVVALQSETFKPGDVFVLNNPYNGGTHLPDVTIVTPVFIQGRIEFYVASRAHHADLGGITPGSMPPQSTTIYEEGILIDATLIVSEGRFLDEVLERLLLDNPYPVRHYAQNKVDLQAQIAANETGIQELIKLTQQRSLNEVRQYMQFIQQNAAEAIKTLIPSLKAGAASIEFDSGACIQVAISINKKAQTLKLDFTGTSQQQGSNFNAPPSITTAAVLYVLRTLVQKNIPLNAGCLEPVEIIIPSGSLLNPEMPAAVVAGNVEVSQAIVDVLYEALGCLAGSQGTMNNFTFGNEQYQYYETIAGGTGAGPSFDGASAVHSHMTNSLLTDPEILETRFPVIVRNCAIRKNSGGTGQCKGGDGLVREIEFCERMSAAILSNRRKIPPQGLKGGQTGLCGRNFLKDAQGRTKSLSATAFFEVEEGDRVIIETPGGGGFGHE